jgi:hypothetical protein
MHKREERRRPAVTRGGCCRLSWLAVAAALALPAAALAASVNGTIADGFYATVEAPHVPTGEDVEFTLHKHSYISGLVLVCSPNAKDASLIADSGEANIGNTADDKKVALRKGDFSYDGPAKLGPADAGAKKVGTTTLDIKGKYVPHGKVYHYTGSIQNKVTATLIFEGTATSPGCIDLPKGHKFYLYTAVSAGG